MSVDYFCSKTIKEDLKGKTVRGGLITIIGQCVRIVISLIAIPILSRLLSPEDFGLVAMVTAITGFAGMFVDSGLAQSTIQKDKINQQQISNLFWFSSTVGLCLAVILCAISPLLAMFYQEPRLIAITIAISISFVLSGMSIQHLALLNRVMNFHSIIKMQIISQLASNVLAVLWAWMFGNYWALVILTISASLFNLITSWILCDWRPTFPRSEDNTRGMIAFGANLTGFRFVNYFARNLDNTLIGWYWGPSQLGFYSQAYRLLLIPLNVINQPVSNIATPVLSRLVSNPPNYRKAYIQILELVLLVTTPLTICIYFGRVEIIDLVLGSQWKEAVPIFAWLVIASGIQPIGNSTGWLFVSQGRGNDMFKWGCISSFIVIIAFIIGLPWGAIGVAKCYVLAELFVRSPFGIFYVTRNGAVSSKCILNCISFPLLLGAFLILILSGIKSSSLLPEGAYGLLSLALLTPVTWTILLLSTVHGRKVLRLSLSQLQDSFLKRPQN